MCNCPIPFLAQNDGESIGNLNYSWCQVSILRLRGMENNILSVAILLSVNKKNAITDVWLTQVITKSKVGSLRQAQLLSDVTGMPDFSLPFILLYDCNNFIWSF